MSAAWNHSAGSRYHCSHLPFSFKPGVAYLLCSGAQCETSRGKMCSLSHSLLDVYDLLMRPVTFMWHSIKDGEADKFFYKLTCFGQQDCSITEGICRLEWCEDESDTRHHFQPTTLYTQEWLEPQQRSFVLILQNSFFSQHVGAYYFKARVTQATEAVWDFWS